MTGSCSDASLSGELRARSNPSLTKRACTAFSIGIMAAAPPYICGSTCIDVTHWVENRTLTMTVTMLFSPVSKLGGACKSYLS